MIKFGETMPVGISTAQLIDEDFGTNFFNNINDIQDQNGGSAAPDVEEVCENNELSSFGIEGTSEKHNEFCANDLKDFDIESSASQEYIEVYASALVKSTENDLIDIPMCPVQHQTSDFELALGLWAEKENIKSTTYKGLLEVL